MVLYKIHVLDLREFSSDFTCLAHLVESFSYKDDQFKKSCLPMKISCPSAEKVN